MRVTFPLLFYLFCSFLLIVIQTSVVPAVPLGGSAVKPDLNLILIICLAAGSRIPRPYSLALLNGFLMDVFSAGILGINTLTRFAVFLVLRMCMSSLSYGRGRLSRFPALFAGTLLMHLLLFAAGLAGGGHAAFLSFELALYQAIINTAVGVPIIMILEKLDGTAET